MASREQGKELRRRRIVDAARELIRETEKTGFSMRALAERAGVSLVTPYNLFGSKQAIMQVLLNEDIQSFGHQLMRSRKDPLDMLFRAVTLGCQWFGKEEEYYRAVFIAVFAENATEYRTGFRGPRLALWRSLVEDAIDGGYLGQDVRAEALSTHLSQVYMANILNWVAGDFSLDEMEQRTLYGFALALHSLAAPEFRDRLYKQILKSQKRYKSDTRSRVRA